MIQMELETLTAMLHKHTNTNNSSELDVKVLMHDREHLTNKIYKLKVCIHIDMHVMKKNKK